MSDELPDAGWDFIEGRHLYSENETGRIIAVIRQDSEGVWLANYERSGESGYVDLPRAMGAMETRRRMDLEAAKKAREEAAERELREKKDGKGTATAEGG